MKLAVMVLPLLLVGATQARADWTVTLLHPDATGSSQGLGAAGGKQIGYTTTSGTGHAVLWSGTKASIVSLHPAGAVNSYCYGAAGTHQVGLIQTATANHAALWTGTAASFVDLQPSGVLSSQCHGAYDDKQVGSTYTSGDDHACFWAGTAASYVDLHPSGAVASFAYCGAGTHQYGEVKFGTTIEAVMWTGTAASYVLLNPAGATRSRVYGCSSTQQVGHAILNDSYHAILWNGSASNYVDLHPATADTSEAKAILGSTIVGDFTKDSLEHACVWSGTAASMVDLQALLPSNYQSSVASAVSNDGVNEYIVGTAYNLTGGRYEAVIWSRPVSPFNFTLNKTTVAGQNSVQGTITLVATSPNATTFTTYDNSSLVTTPATVTVPANTLLKNFQITVTAVTSPINTTIYAKLGTIVQSQPLILAPLVPTALSFTPNPVTGGQTTSCKVVVNGVAGPGGRVIAILDNSSYSTVPSTVTVPAGASSVTFNIATTHPAVVQNVTVTARVSAGEKTGTFRINP